MIIQNSAVKDTNLKANHNYTLPFRTPESAVKDTNLKANHNAACRSCGTR